MTYIIVLAHTGLVLSHFKNWGTDFPGSTVEKNRPANAGDTGSIPGPGRFHMPQRN